MDIHTQMHPLITQPDPRWNKATGFTFLWFAEELGLDDWRFELPNIERIYLKIEQLKVQFDDVKTQTVLINKRESLLNVELTQFTELFQIQEFLKPLFELWEVAVAFGK